MALMRNGGKIGHVFVPAEKVVGPVFNLQNVKSTFV